MTGTRLFDSSLPVGNRSVVVREHYTLERCNGCFDSDVHRWGQFEHSARGGQLL
ncbi:hypothetical protein GLAREA_08415 [Glarea lozoyensis ATCC 20868]|uniref:Uncharacterized protein n=1 Tax=Glarea lozoyensis (strain ATCC 20868 / MF5171) TaxID=1116229 RepID=S3DCZ3_GLAL2|nr:uncharacterized protein GLAREA_08415 [Glarea lozoyensis ATCC 20868]EPE24563.1 hypothetical protein GLAREA_08415 [Glarea lozoyensis ATCC 20868]